jgi:hypothetical protein
MKSMDRTGPKTVSNKNDRIYFLELDIGSNSTIQNGLVR